MTDDELKAIEERANAATTDPYDWEFLEVGLVGADFDPTASHAPLIRHCREDVPALCAEVRRLQATEAVLNSEVQRLRAVLTLSEEQDETLLAADVEDNK